MSDYAYIFRRPCGCKVVIIVDNPDRKKENAKEIAKHIRDGLTLERLPLAEAVADFGFNCEPCIAQQKAKRKEPTHA